MSKSKSKRDEYISKLKRVYLAENGVDISDVKKYEKYISDSEDESIIQRQAQELASDINVESDYADVHIDGTTWKPF